MEKEIGRETEMEEGTGGRRKGRKGNERGRSSRARKQNKVNKRLFSQSGHLFHFSKFTLDPLQRQGQSERSPSFCRPKSQSLPGN